MEGEQGVKIEFSLKKDVDKPKASLTPDLFMEGRLFSSQNWVRRADIPGAKAYVRGDERAYPNKPVIAYSFIDSQGRECYLVGDGHHRTAEGIVQSEPVEAVIDASLGTLNEKVLENPNFAAQKLGILGIEGIWPFNIFMEKLIEEKSQMKREKI